MPKILVLHGPNLNLLGKREPAFYGNATLSEIDNTLMACARTADITLNSFQSNIEGELINRVHNAKETNVDFILFNPAAFTHTSVALRDALSAVEIPFIEIHLSNIHARESFRQRSYFSDIAVGCITGFGAHSYYLALEAAIHKL